MEAPVLPSLGPQRKALCIGLQYDDRDTKFRLGASHRDARRMAKFLKKYGFEVTVMLDNDAEDSPLLPTKENVCREIKKLCADARPGDKLFFHYSGHGTQIDNLNGTEFDKLDEVLLLHGFVENEGFRSVHCRDRYKMDTVLLDDELYEMFATLPSGSLLTAICDSCHSGTVFDLPYTRRCSDMFSFFQDESIRERPVKQPSILLLSACDDSQTTFENGSGGFFVGAFLKCMREYRGSTTRQLLSSLCRTMREDVEHGAKKAGVYLLEKDIPSPRCSSFRPPINNFFARRL